MFIRNVQTTILQIFFKFMHNLEVILITSNIDPDDTCEEDL